MKEEIKYLKELIARLENGDDVHFVAAWSDGEASSLHVYGSSLFMAGLASNLNVFTAMKMLNEPAH